jgi:hypothetical protein
VSAVRGKDSSAFCCAFKTEGGVYSPPEGREEGWMRVFLPMGAVSQLAVVNLLFYGGQVTDVGWDKTYL